MKLVNGINESEDSSNRKNLTEFEDKTEEITWAMDDDDRISESIYQT